ncbi:hypothetical protein NT05LI_3300 [Listeria ivanovii FSL F6-596]|nr:hypothetical protein NT05LI_3300 [Listeria ivanovii FSL F6-596]
MKYAYNPWCISLFKIRFVCYNRKKDRFLGRVDFFETDIRDCSRPR